MSLKIDRVQLEIIIKNDESRKQMSELETDIKRTKNELAKMQKQGKEGTEEYIQKLSELKQKQSIYDSLIDKIGLTNLSIKELTARQKELNAILSNMKPGKEFDALKTQLDAVKNRLGELRGKTQETQSAFSSFGSFIGKAADGFNKYFGLLGAFAAILTGVVFSLTSIVKGNAALADSFSDIQKTTGMTAVEVKKLNEQLGKINTRTPSSELRNMAVVAGQLGIAKNDVLAFVNSTDKLNVALGDEMTGGAQAVAEEMGKLRNVLVDVKSQNVAEDMLHIGNALNELGADGAATAPVVADFANRIGGVGITLGLTSGQVLGLSATLQELNVTTERGGTAVVKILQKMTTETGTFAKIAGMDVKDFTKLVKEDLYGAFTKVIEGSKKLGTSNVDLANIIKELEVQGAGASEVFAKLGNNTEMLAKKTTLASTSLQETNSIMNEFELKNNNLAGSLEKIGKWFNSLFVSSAITESLSSLVNWFAKLVSKSDEVSTSMEKEQMQVNLLVQRLTEANISAEERNKIYDELNAIAPQVLQGINKEAIAYDQLRMNLEKYNEEQINRIVIQKKQEELDKQNLIVADKLTEKLKAEEQARADLNSELNIAKKFRDNYIANYQKEEDAIASIYGRAEGQKRAKERLMQLGEYYNSVKQIVSSNAFTLEERIQSVGDAAYSILGQSTFKKIGQDLGFYTQEFNKAKSASDNIIAQREKLKKELGISDVKVETTAVTKEIISSDYTDDKTTANKIKVENDFEEFMQKLRAASIIDETKRAMEELDLWRKKEADKITESKWSAKQRNEAEIQLQTTYNVKKAEIEKKANEEHEKILLDFAAFIDKNNKDLQDKRQSELDIELAKVDDKYRTEAEKLKQNYDKKLITDAEYFDMLEQLEYSRIESRDAVKLQEEEKFQKAKLQVLEKYDQNNPAVLAAKLAEQRANFEKELELFKGNEEMKAQLRASFESGQTQTKLSGVRSAVSSIDKANTTGKDNSMSERLAALESEEQQKLDLVTQYQTNDLENYQSYENIKSEIARTAQQERLAIIEDEINQAQQLTETFANFFAAQKNAELAVIDKNYSKQADIYKREKNNELKIAGNDAAKKQLIEEKYSKLETDLTEQTEAQKKSIAKKYANIEFAAKISQIVANTAVAVMKALADLGPIAGGVAAAIITGTGLFQLSAAKAERDKVLGLETGGYLDVTRAQDGRNYTASYNPNKRGFVSTPTVLVGEDNKPEYVVSSSKLAVPGIRRMVDVIESTSPTELRRLDVAGAFRNSAIMRGYENGGFTTSTNAATFLDKQPATVQMPQNPELVAAINALNSILTSGIVAKVGFFDFMDKYNQYVKLQDNIILK